MAIENLWAPWRMEFIRGLGGKAGGCFLCAAAAGRDDRANLVVRRGRTALCLLNRYPYNNGHLLISPFRHEGKIEALSREELAEILSMTIAAKKLLDRLMSSNGYNIGINLGRAAGAGLDEHFHLHVVPRWSGDTNFVTTVGSVKVIPQALEELWRLLDEEWKKEPPC